VNAQSGLKGAKSWPAHLVANDVQEEQHRQWNHSDYDYLITHARRMIPHLRNISSDGFPAHPVQISIRGRISAKLFQVKIDYGTGPLIRRPCVPCVGLLRRDKMWD